MGYSLAWLAVKGKAPETVREALCLRCTGDYEGFPESDITAAVLPNGWYLIVMDDMQVASDNLLQEMTLACEAVTCFVEEHVMLSAAAGWRNGERTWAITHNSEHGIEHLEIQGELPTAFAPICDRLLSEQRAAGGADAGVDFIFDVPVELAAIITGYRHDREAPELGDRAFEVLECVPNETEKLSLFERLFGRNKKV